MRKILILTLVILGLLIQVNTVQAQSPSPDGVGTCILYQQITWQVKEVFPSPEGTRQRIQDVSDANRNRIVTLAELLKLGEGFGAKIVPCPGAPVTTTLVPQPAPASDVTDIMMSLPIPLPALVAVGVVFVLAITGGLALYSRKPSTQAAAAPTKVEDSTPLTPEERALVDLCIKNGVTQIPVQDVVELAQERNLSMMNQFRLLKKLQIALAKESQSAAEEQNQEGVERRGKNAPEDAGGKITMPKTSNILPRSAATGTSPTTTSVGNSAPPQTVTSPAPASSATASVKPQRAKRTLAAAVPARATSPSTQTSVPASDQTDTGIPSDPSGIDPVKAAKNWAEMVKKVNG